MTYGLPSAAPFGAPRGFTLIEVALTIGLLALVTSVALNSLNAVTGANLRSTSMELTGTIKENYDRAIMLKRTQRLAMNLDTGTWWIDFSEDPFAISAERVEGVEGASAEKKDDDDDDDFGRRRSSFGDEADPAVLAAMGGGRSASFAKDDSFSSGKPIKLPDGTCFSRVWTAHQEEPFRSGIAYLHFFKGGWTEPALIEIVDSECEEKVSPDNDDESQYMTLRVLPLTGRVRLSEDKLVDPDVDDVDGRDEGDTR